MAQARREPGAEVLRVLQAGDEDLPFLHRHAGEDQLLPPEGLHAPDQPRPPGHEVGGRPPVGDLRLRHPLPDLDMGLAAGDVDGDPAELRDLQKDVVAEVLGPEAEAEGAELHAVALQGAQDLLVADGAVAFNGEIPDEKGAEEEGQGAESQAEEQRVAPPEAAEEVGRAPAALQPQLAGEVPQGQAQQGVVPPGQGAAQALLPRALHVPEAELPLGAEIEKALRKGAVHPDADLTPEAAAHPLQHPSAPIPRRRFRRRCAGPPPSWRGCAAPCPAGAGPPPGC